MSTSIIDYYKINNEIQALFSVDEYDIGIVFSIGIDINLESLKNYIKTRMIEDQDIKIVKKRREYMNIITLSVKSCNSIINGFTNIIVSCRGKIIIKKINCALVMMNIIMKIISIIIQVTRITGDVNHGKIDVYDLVKISSQKKN